VNLRLGISTESEFVAADLIRPRILPAEQPRVNLPIREPIFLPPPRFFRFRWWELLAGFFSSYPLHLRNISGDLFRQNPLQCRRFVGKPFAASLGVHIMGISLLPFLMQFVPPSDRADNTLQKAKSSIVYYNFSKMKQLQKSPDYLPKGPGSKPGIGDLANQVPAKGSSKSLKSSFAISRPHLPDNNHQTILQSAMSDLKIKTDPKLPNLLVQQSSAPKPRVEINSAVHPLQPIQHETHPQAPELTKSVSPQAVNGLPGLSSKQARLQVPIGSMSAPVIPSGSMKGEVDAPPKIAGTEMIGQGLLALGMDPSKSAGVLPPGNQYGQFSIAPGTSGPGSPGGVADIPVGGGAGGKGAGGNDSAGAGNGDFGGGGSSAAASGFITLRGGGREEFGLSEPGPSAAAQLVYAIPIASLIRHNALVVSAGPMGGGGSNVYGALPCGRIYTVFLTAGTKQWSLQYCQKALPSVPTEKQTTKTIVHAEMPLIPPEAEASYSFRRLPVPAEKAHKPIVLKGAIDESGKVQDLNVYMGLSPTLDAAACLAFKQWRFKPAMRSGKPVRVEILLSIPWEEPKS